MRRCLCTCTLFLALPTLAQAQFYPYGYPQGGIYGRQGGTLYGASQVIGQTGNMYIQQEQARVEREKANQAKIDTKRKAFDEMMYEKANTPAWSEDQAKISKDKLRRIMNDPNPYEIARGDTLNFMMPVLRQFVEQGIPGPPMTLSSSILKAINVTTGDGGGVGMLAGGGTKLTWPLALQGPTQKELATLIPEAVKQSAAGELQAPLYTKILSKLKILGDEARKKYSADQIDSQAYLSGKHFLEALTSSVQALQRPDAQKYLDGTFAARGNNVQELVMNMSNEGLQFAPATPGYEYAYRSLHNSFVSYARVGQSPGGFQPPSFSSPITTPYRKN